MLVNEEHLKNMKEGEFTVTTTEVETNPFPLIPNRTEILSRKVKVKFEHDNVRGINGNIDCNTGEMTLYTNYRGIAFPQEEVEITYLHEIMHFILAKTGWSSKLDKRGIDEEELVEDIAIGIYQALTKAED